MACIEHSCQCGVHFMDNKILKECPNPICKQPITNWFDEDANNESPTGDDYEDDDES